MKKLLVATAALLCVPGVAAAQDDGAAANFDGVRAEVRLGYETPTVSGDGDVYKIGSAVSFGGELGFDFKASSQVTVGPFANYEVSSVEVCDGADCIKEKGNWAAGGRIGVAVSPKAAIYAKLGYASIRLKATSGGLTGSDSQGGAYGAIGAEFSVAKHFYVNVEAAYADYGDFYGTGFNLQRRHVSVGAGFRF